MARVTLDVYSGRPNPTWELDEAEAKEILKQVQSAPELVTPEDAGPAILGYRGLVVTLDEAAGGGVGLDGVPARFRVGHGAAGDRARSFELAERLLAGAGKAVSVKPGPRGDRTAFDDTNLQTKAKKFLLDASTSDAFLNAPTDPEVVARSLRELKGHEGRGPKDGPQPAEGGIITASSVEEAFDVSAQACWYPASVIGRDASTWSAFTVGSCSMEASAFNASFWNTTSVQPYNNCYNYASNRRTDTFAQPGWASCSETTVMACSNVSTASSADGAIRYPTCASSSPRWYMALVIWPGEDYHWYRYQSNGYWGHKPGRTAAKNTDNSGAVIYNPETANRGGYTNFCGYWFSPATHGIA